MKRESELDKQNKSDKLDFKLLLPVNEFLFKLSSLIVTPSAEIIGLEFIVPIPELEVRLIIVL